jgi:putative ABC transport system permease protein
MILSLLVGAAVISMLLNLYGGVGRKMEQEFRAYGSNAVVAPRSSTSPETATSSGVMDEAVMKTVQEFVQQRRGGIAAPVLYAVVRLQRFSPDPRLPQSANVVAVGTDLAALCQMNRGWGESKPRGYSTPLSQSNCAIGAGIAAHFHIGPGDAIYLQPLTPPAGPGVQDRAPCRISTVLTTGSSEDDQVFLPLQELQSMIGMTGKISLVHLSVPGDTSQIEHSIRELSKALPGVEVRPIRQIVYSEGRILGVIRRILFSVTALILIIIAICVTATMTAMVLERRKDIGAMKAMGASDRQVMQLFLAEGAALGMGGGCAGFFLGGVCADGLAHHLFGVTLNLIWWILPLVCGFDVLLALGAAVCQHGTARAMQPAAVLRGE